MIWTEYMEKARITAVYPIRWRVAYPALGLIGELIELFYNHSIDEAGDVCWYIANLSIDLGFVPELKEHKGQDLIFTIGQLAEATKRHLREDNEDKISVIKECTEKIMQYIRKAFDLEKVLERNIQKLEDRKARGVLKGSGDDR